MTLRGLTPAYAELHCRSNFSFLTGASHAEELVERAIRLGYTALAITDEGTLAGVVRAHEAVRQQHQRRIDAWRKAREDASLPAPDDEAPPRPIHLIIGCELRVAQPASDPDTSLNLGPLRLVVLAMTREGYGHLSELITVARLRAAKGEYRLYRRDLDAPAPERAHLRGLPECQVLLIPDRGDDETRLIAQTRWLAATFGERASIALALLRRADDALLTERVLAASAASGVPVVATGDVLMHVRSRKPLQDTLTATRLGRSLHECGTALATNAEQHLRSRLALSQLYRPAWLARSVEIAAACTFSLAELRYEYPDEIVPAGHTPASWLRHETEAGAARHYPQGVPESVRAQIEKELALIAELKYEAFFLTVHDVVKFARSRHILCQGRGSAANSTVCYCLDITAVPPEQTQLLFERFISRERAEPPDIDVDFEHERREEVIQYLYAKYGTERTALAAAVSTYRVRGAVRDVGKALGLDALVIDAIAKSHQWFDGKGALDERFVEAGLDPQAAVTQHWSELVRTLLSFPRHLSQHSGGFVIAKGPLSRLVPIEPAAMDGRRIIQWDKDDLESLGLLKVDVLALGMLTVLRKTLDLANARCGRTLPVDTLDHDGRPHPRAAWALPQIPRDDAPTWSMLQNADTVGMFQVESRAQQSMLPRLKPDKFYDLVVEVAIVRPGPIQGGMVHPYLRRKQGLEPHTSPYTALNEALERTLGVPIFQEQVMQVCMIAAGFSAGEADGMRRAMAAWRRKGGVHHYHDRVVEGMVERGYDRAFAEGIFQQILGFGDYGFPESHAFGFAILAWFSAWMKCHEPEAFLAALLNSQPMGFYAPSQLVQDARRPPSGRPGRLHAVTVLPVDVTCSDWDCTLETRPGHERPAVRLGLRMVDGFAQTAAERLVRARADGLFADVQDLGLRAGLDTPELQRLARADALRTLAGHRRQQVWAAAAGRAGVHGSLLHATPVVEAAPVAQLSLLEAPEAEAVTLDYAATGLSLRNHPLALLRERLRARGVRSTAELLAAPPRPASQQLVVWACGLVTTRQQPGTAKGTVFVTLEDETGPLNVIVWRSVRLQYRQALLGARLLAVQGVWQQRNGVAHLIARRLVDAGPWLARQGAEPPPPAGEHCAGPAAPGPSGDLTVLGDLVTVSRDFH